jgi:putative ABC transport system permease protein
VFPDSDPALAEQVAEDPDVVDATTAMMLLGNGGTSTARGPDDSGPVEPMALASVHGPPPLVLRHGRPPGAGEAALGSKTLDRLGAAIGDVVTLDGFAGEKKVMVVGETVDPGNDELNEGFAVTSDTLASLTRACVAGDTDLRCRTMPTRLMVDLRPGADAEAVAGRLAELQPLSPTPAPSVIENLDEIGSTPWWLAAFLVMLGVAGIAHAVVVSAQRQRHDLAIARVLGMKPHQVSAVLRWAAVFVVVLGVAVGLVLGVAAGQLIWRRVAEGVGALVDTVIPARTILLALVGAVVVGLALSMLPGHRAARMRPGEVLRSE